MRRLCLAPFVFLFILACLSRVVAQDGIARPPAVPLVVHDPYFSVWSFSDHPAKDITRHWTGKTMSLFSMVMIDGRTYSLLGSNVDSLPMFPVVSTEITATRTIYRYKGAGVALTMTFTSPLLPDSLDQLSRPLSYLSWLAESADGKDHAIRVYVDASAEFCLDTPDEKVTWGRAQIPGLDVLQMGSSRQPVLEKRGDDVRIDWGYLYLTSPKGSNEESAIAGAERIRQTFIGNGRLPGTDDLDMPRQGNDNWPVLAISHMLTCSAKTPAEAVVMLAYDDVYSIEYLQRPLRPYWRRDGMTMGDLLSESATHYRRLAGRCEEFDRKLASALEERGGKEYAAACILAYRQILAAHKLAADIDGTPMLFPKENFSNGCISTVDVIYPSAPFFLYCNPRLAEALLTPVFAYAELARWRFPFAPHDLGTYPHANGQVYGGGERDELDQMPVEESGNMIILTYALARQQHSASFAAKHWKCLATWAGYLKEKGLDPENQLCTDDFTGHLAHNTNLSVKAIVALGCYAKLCAMTGKDKEGRAFEALAQNYAREWEKMARDGDHYRLAFDKANTWSMKYNLVWDSVLELGIFPAEVRTREMAYYATKLNQYGLPLDNRADFTKPEWMTWVAAMASSRDEFRTYMKSIVAYLNATPDRIPFCDWYDTKTAKKEGFRARSVVGGMYLPMLQATGE